MINSKYAPISTLEYGAKDLNANYQGTFFTAINSSTTEHDYKVIDDHIIDGAEISVIGAPIVGDYFITQVVDKDYLFAGIFYPADYNGTAWSVVAPTGVVLNTFVPKWYVIPGLVKQMSHESKYPAKIFHGLYLRIKYVSVGLTDVNVIANFKLHKVLW